MKIISGFMKGAIIPTVKNAKYRPSTGKFKEALFSILTSGEFTENSPIIDKEVLDLFSGTCAIGFEAISRGAKHATFIDIDRDNSQIARNFAKKMNIEDKVDFKNSDITNLGFASKQYDLIFIDPPYNEGLADKTLTVLHKKSWLKKNSLVVVEIGVRETLSANSQYTIYMERKYGASKMIILHYVGDI